MCSALRFCNAFSLLFSDATTEIKAFAGSSVDLPCKVDVSQCGDLHSVKWYRDTSRIYVFSQVGGIKRAEGDATERSVLPRTLPHRDKDVLEKILLEKVRNSPVMSGNPCFCFVIIGLTSGL